MFVVFDNPPNEDDVSGITKMQPFFNDKNALIRWGCRVNPNKYLYGNNQYINTYSEFINATDEMLHRIGVTDYEIQRIDYRIDSYDNTFDELYKLNNVIINILSMSLGIDNCYQSIKNDAPHNIVARNKHKTMECYDRIAKDGDGLTKTRIELRREYPYFNTQHKDIINVVGNEWINTLNSKLLSAYYMKFQTLQNDRILQEWKRGKQKGTIRNYIDLLAKNKDYIYTSQQMNNLCNLLGLATDVAYTYKNRLQIEYYNYKIIDEYINKIIRALDIFLMS